MIHKTFHKPCSIGSSVLKPNYLQRALALHNSVNIEAYKRLLVGQCCHEKAGQSPLYWRCCHASQVLCWPAMSQRYPTVSSCLPGRKFSGRFHTGLNRRQQ